MTPTTPLTSFNGLGIAPKLLEILDRLKFKVPTPIQYQSIPAALEGKDLMGIAQTGTGKTLAFGVPMVQLLAKAGGKGLILLPTRELAVQVNEELNKIGRGIGLRTVVLIGGENMGKQIRELRNRPHVFIATPGRLLDHMEQKTIKLDDVRILVLDEADRMLDMGFAPQIKRVLAVLPKVRQTMLFSATMPPEITQIANAHMKLPVRVEVAPQGTSAKNVTQEVFIVHKHQKQALLENLLKEYKGSVLVFTRTKFGAKKIAAQLKRNGLSSAEIHSNRSLSQRLEALSGFKIGKYRVLVATDIAARGIDVTGIEVVINFDLPEQASDYVHRIGRTGRAERSGHAISFVTAEQKYDLRAIERLIKKELPISKTPILPQSAPVFDEPYAERRPRQPFGRGRDRFSSRGGQSAPQRDGNRPFGDSKKPRFMSRKPKNVFFGNFKQTYKSKSR